MGSIRAAAGLLARGTVAAVLALALGALAPVHVGPSGPFIAHTDTNR